MPPERVVDVLALVGDAVDNVPGVPGIGDKGARDLVREFGPVESVLENADKVKRAAYREGLKAHAAEALLSKQLVTLRKDVPVALDLEAIVRREPDRAACPRALQGARVPGAREGVRARGRVGGRRAPAADSTRPSVEAVVAEARAAGRVALGVVVTSAQAMRAGPSASRSRGRPGGPSTCPSATRRLDLPQGALGREPRRSSAAAAAARGRRACARPRPTPSATGSSSAGSGSRSRASPSTRSSPRTSSTPAGAAYAPRGPRVRVPRRAAAPAGRTASPPTTPPRARRPGRGRRDRARPAPRRADERAARRGGAAPDLRVDGDAARRGARRHGAGRGQGRHAPARAR